MTTETVVTILAGKTERGVALRFFRETVLSYAGDECLVWPFCRDRQGYGRICRNRRPHKVSRLVCEEIHGPPPTPEHEAAHSCGRGHEGCVNGKHLRWATSAENSADQLIHGTVNRGERHGQAKLTETDIRGEPTPDQRHSSRQEVGLAAAAYRSPVRCGSTRHRTGWRTTMRGRAGVMTLVYEGPSSFAGYTQYARRNDGAWFVRRISTTRTGSFRSPAPWHQADLFPSFIAAVDPDNPPAVFQHESRIYRRVKINARLPA